MVKKRTLKALMDYLTWLGLIPKVKDAEVYRVQPPELNLCNTVHKDEERMFLFLTLSNVGETKSYSAEQVRAVLPASKEFRHDIYQGISTRLLEDLLRHLDWTPAQAEKINEPCVTFDIYNDLLLLWNGGNKSARETAAVLMLKYWTNTAMEQYIPSDLDRSQFEKELIAPLNGNHNDLNPLEIYNLLQGRAVMKFTDGFDPNSCLQWVMAEDGKLAVYPGFNFDEQLKILPLAVKPTIVTGVSYLVALSEGNRKEDVFEIAGIKVTGFIEADPKAGILKVTDKNNKELFWDLSEKKRKEHKQLPSVHKANRKPGKAKSLK